MPKCLRFALLSVVAAVLQAATTPPVPSVTVNPGYPEALRDTGLNGAVVINLLIRADGTVGEASIKSADHPAFGDAALAAVRGWKFEPARKDGAPVDIRVALPFQFTAPVDQVLNSRFKRRVFRDLPEMPLTEQEFGGKLKITHRAQPLYPPALLRSGTEENVVVRFVVGPDGHTFNPVIEGTPRNEFMLPAMAAAANSTYEPPLKDNKPVHVETRLTFHFSDPASMRKAGGSKDSP